MIEELAAENHVKVLGFIDNIQELISRIDMGVFNSDSEALPNVVLECMAAELVLLGTDIKGISECVCDKNLPYLFLQEDYQKFAENILSLYRNTELRNEIGKLNKRKVQTMFSVEQFFSKTAEVIHKLLNR